MARQRVRDHATQLECVRSEPFASCGSVLVGAGQVAFECRIVLLQPYLGPYEEVAGAVAGGEGRRGQGDVGSGECHA